MKDCTILGLDISTKSTGWSIVEYKNEKMKLIDYGCIERHKMTIPESLVHFEKELIKILDKFEPDCVSAEAPFVGSNRVTIQKLSNFHGVALMVLEKYKLSATYYSVMTLKSQTLDKMVLKKEDGTKKTGQELKQEVQDKVIEIFGKENFHKSLNDDMSDSISACVCYVKMDGKEVEKTKKKRKKKE